VRGKEDEGEEASLMNTSSPEFVLGKFGEVEANKSSLMIQMNNVLEPGE
tara:strand:- start:607 stop:753 length:147 start_codon:yes stop_codon:yes gene_type:complete